MNFSIQRLAQRLRYFIKHELLFKIYCLSDYSCRPTFREYLVKAHVIFQTKGLLCVLKCLIRSAIKYSFSLLLSSNTTNIGKTLDTLDFKKRAILIYSHVPYMDPMKQRPQHIAESLASKDCYVFYSSRFIEKGIRKSSIVRLKNKVFLLNQKNETTNQILDYFKGISVLVYATDITHLNHQTYNAFSKKANVIVDYLDKLDSKVLGCDTTQYQSFHNYLLQDCYNILIASSDYLVKHALKYRQKAHLVPNACNPQDFAYKPKLNKVSKDMQHIIGQKQPIIGFFGALAKWLDYDLLVEIACLKPEYSFVFIGCDYDQSCLKLKKKNLPNVYFLGTIPYSNLKYYAVWFDVSIIPFLIEDLTHAVSPVKLFEYMAIGKPIVATRTQELEKYKSVLFANTAKEFAAKLDEAIAKQQDKKYKKIMQKELHDNTWDYRAKKIIKIIEEYESQLQ
jgi:teichuronic acid biosynthesis glycosyltransferase TuaH